MTGADGTWHHGLIARHWAEFNAATPEELAGYGGAIEAFGQPALDVGCGAGRILLPLLERGLDVDGVDISDDMLAQCRRLAAERGLSPTLHRQAMHELALPRRYRTVYICDSFGIGGDRANDLEALRQIRALLEPGGALVFSHWLPHEGHDATSWARWLAAGRSALPAPWPEAGERRRLPDGDDLELLTRIADLDPMLQRHTLQIRARLWRGEALVAEEQGELLENLYFVPELRLLLDAAGFGRVTIRAGYTDRPATRDDEMIVVTAEA